MLVLWWAFLASCFSPFLQTYEIKPNLMWPKLRGMISRRPSRIIRQVTSESLTYLEEAALSDLCYRVTELERRRGEGILIEAGCALGGSAIVIASAKAKSRPFFVYDCFGMIPPPSDRDGPDAHERFKIISGGQSSGINGHTYYGYESGLLEKVTANFRRLGFPVEANNVHLVQGLFEAAMRIEQPVELAHIDGDWYDSVMTCLQRIEPHLVRGGVLVLDDYAAWSGCRKAVDDYFATRRGGYSFVQMARLHIIRK